MPNIQNSKKEPNQEKNQADWQLKLAKKIMIKNKNVLKKLADSKYEEEEKEISEKDRQGNEGI